MTQESRRRQLALLLRGLEARVTNLEQQRRADAAIREVAGVVEAGVELGPETVSTTKKTDFTFQYDTAGNGYDESEWA